jgi:DNA (cytosine-5)-methyltransferase 1
MDHKETYILFGMGGAKETPDAKQTDVASTIMARDWKGLNNYGSNGVIETMEVRRLGGLFDGKTTHQAGSVFDKERLSPTIDTMQGGCREPMIIEPNSEGIANTLTTVQKDNMVLETIALDEQNMNVRTETVGTLTTDGSSPKHNNRIIEKQIKVIGNYMESNHDASRVVDTDGIAPTVKENHGTVTGIVDTVRIKEATKKGYAECNIGGVADLLYPTSTTRRGRVQDNGETCPTILSGENGIHRIESMYRIRKLTPKECWRLMDFSDEDFHKAEKVCSNSQLYKQAGNSIVKNVLVAIFGQMIPGKENVYKEI